MKPDIIVIGAGIIGLATTEHLLRQGANVMLIERNLAGHESSWAGGGILAPLHPWNYTNEVTLLTSYSAMQFSGWVSSLREKTGIDAEHEKSGMLVLPPYDEAAARHWCSQQNIKFEFSTISKGWFDNDTKKYEPALFLSDVAQVRNPRLIHALYLRIVQLGGKIIENCAISKLHIEQQYVQSVTTTCGEFSADSYVVSAGTWSEAILGDYALGLKIRPVKGQMLLFKYDSPPTSTILVRNDTYLIPRRDGHLLVGSTLEDSGFNKQITDTAKKYLLTQACTLLPSLDKQKIIRHWAGLRPSSPGNIPTIGRHPEIRNLFINSGHFRYGVTMAPASAEILTNEITGKGQPFDISPYQWRQ
ncbi:MAG: glycine oxidase ThiO [Nitrosomonas sp.]|nr:MAG: glycine oxidase ThiO [Nitrosomonas sp.]